MAERRRLKEAEHTNKSLGPKSNLWSVKVSVEGALDDALCFSHMKILKKIRSFLILSTLKMSIRNQLYLRKYLFSLHLAWIIFCFY